ncbi:MAG: shikimate dehydrogenase [Candidatus Riflebacteria bacterium]|nr:shikimate dehydrogenase [Candidatus Riflebacteria bacterium]
MTPRITRDTVLCISIAASPGNLGSAIHNAGYAALGLDFVYKACRVHDLAGAMAGVRALGIRGCSVSTPFKREVLAHLDELDQGARAVGAVNTIVNDGGRLTGFNTDVDGAVGAFDEAGILSSDRVLVLGAGGVARAIVHALRLRGVACVTVACRSPAPGGLPGLPVVPWSERQEVQAEILINATPVGMDPAPEALPMAEPRLRSFRAVVDVVAVPPVSSLVRAAARAGLVAVPGHVMALHQAIRQFELYTGQKAPQAAMREALLAVLAASGRG